MAFVVSSLVNYVKTNEQILIMRSFFEPKTATYMQKMTDVKSSAYIPNIDDTMYWQTGGTCGLINASGDTTLNTRTLTVGKIKAERQWCIADLEAKYTQLLLAKGSQYENLPGGIDAAVMDFILGAQKEKIEQAIWQGDTTVWQDYLNKFDGLIKIIGAGSGTVAANAAAYMTPVTSVITSNIIAVMDGIVAAIPIEILDKPDLRVWIGTDWARKYQAAMKAANLYHFTAPANAQGEFEVYGTGIKVVPCPGLNGKDKAYAMRTTNMWLGVDLESEEEDLKVWYSEDYDVVNARLKFKMGVQVGILTEIVKFTL